VADHAHGFRGIPEALHLRDHLIRQVELAAGTSDEAERAARCTFVVVGAGYTGTEVTAQGQLLTEAVSARYPALRSTPLRWLLVDTGGDVLHGMDPHLRRTAGRVLRDRGVEVRTHTSLTRATSEGVELSDGDSVASRTLVWCVGVRPDPLAAATGLPMREHRLEVDPYLNVTGHPEVFAAGDAAAVPDPDHDGRPAPMTAQHAVREGRVAARNLAASLGVGQRRAYRHRSLGFLVDLGGRQAAANPLHVPLSGLPARAVTRAYHLAAMPANRVHTIADWVSAAVSSRPPVQLGLVPGSAVPLDTDAPELPHPG
jgi:NADH dehydrogenase